MPIGELGFFHIISIPAIPDHCRASLPSQEAAPPAACPRATSADLSSGFYQAKETCVILNYFYLSKDYITLNLIFFLAPVSKPSLTETSSPIPHLSPSNTPPGTSRSLPPHTCAGNPPPGRSARARYPSHKERTRTYSLISRKQLLTVNNWYKAVMCQLKHRAQHLPGPHQKPACQTGSCRPGGNV